MSATKEKARPANAHPEMTQLCNLFPTLRGVPGTAPWDQHAFARWASGPAPSNAMRQAAAFVISVWNGCTPDEGGWWNNAEEGYCAGRFDPVQAFALWDWEHQAAFMQWCNAPFWP